MTPTDRREALERIRETLRVVERSSPIAGGCGLCDAFGGQHAAGCPLPAAIVDVEALLAAAERGDPWP